MFLLALQVGNNRISGTLPDAFGAWKSLINFQVDGNDLTGTLPIVYALWSELQRFVLNNNNFTGTLPPEYANWTLLAGFSVDNNSLSGVLPPSYGLWTNLVDFRAEANRLSGTFPKEYASWSFLRSFYVQGNHYLSGTLPSEYANWSNLLRLSAYQNNISGTLPPSYAAWHELTSMSLYSNNLTGTLPPEYAQWGASLLEFTVFNNSISGTMPASYGRWAQLQLFAVDSNNVSGTLPPEYGNWTDIERFSVVLCKLTGTLPDAYRAWSRVQSLTFSGNSISGTIPPSYTMLAPGLLWLNDNELSGSVPALRVWQILTLHNNPNLRGTLPRSAGPTLAVSICNTSLCGAVPPSWAAGYTRGFCFNADASQLDEVLARVATLPAVVLPSCPSAAVSSRNGSSSTPNLHHISGTLSGVGAVGVVAGAMTPRTSSLGVLMYVSVRSVVMAQRVASCTDVDATDMDNGAAVGELISDNPTRLSLPGRTPLTSGTVLGNFLLLVSIPVLVVVAAATTRVLPRSALTLGASLTMCIWGVVLVPTVAATVYLGLDAVHGTVTASGVVWCAVGALYLSGALTLIVHLWVQLRRCDGRQVHSCGLDAQHDVLTVVTLRNRMRSLLCGSRSVWVLPVFPRDLSRRRKPVKSRVVDAVRGLVHALGVQLLSGCHYPHCWVLLYDGVCGVVVGVLVGAASSPFVSCSALRGAVWTLFGVSCVQSTVAAALRPRSTAADCLFEGTMATWTAASTCLAALGIDDGVDESSMAQSLVALLWGVPVLALRVHRSCAPLHAERHHARRLSANASTAKTRTVTTASSLHRGHEEPRRFEYMSSDAALMQIVKQICRSNCQRSSQDTLSSTA